MVKSRRMRWKGHAARIRKETNKNTYRILVGYPEEKLEN
jgi:hypothetical protein